MKDLNSIPINSQKHMRGDESFTYNGQETDLTMLEYWRWHYSEIFDLHDTIAEYIVAKALRMQEAHNVGYWTLFDILYRGYRIEVKETSYYHAWQSDEEEKSQVRNFGITKAYTEYQNSTSEKKRQNDIYVFCLNTGETKATSNPLQLEHWEFYIVPTNVINEKCGDAKTISLSRIRKLTKACTYSELKNNIDRIIDNNNSAVQGGS